jgi:hypothetical protein
MNGTESSSTSSTAPATELERQLGSLRLCVAIGLGCATVLGGSLSLFLYGQHRTVSNDLREARKFIDDYNTNAVPTLQSLQRNLANFAAANPNLTPILQKYGITNRPAAPSPSTGGAAPIRR